MPLASRLSAAWVPLLFRPSRLARLGRERSARLIRFSGVAGIGVSRPVGAGFYSSGEPLQFFSNKAQFVSNRMGDFIKGSTKQFGWLQASATKKLISPNKFRIRRSHPN